MRIGIVTSSFPLAADDASAAAGVFVRDFATAVAALGHEVHVITQDKGHGCAEPPEGVFVDCYPWPGKERPLSQLSMTNLRDVWWTVQLMTRGKRALVQLHDRVGLDHVLAMWTVPAGLLAEHLKKRHHVPFSVWCLGSDIWTYGRRPIARRIVARVLQAADHRFADGLRLASDAERLGKLPVKFLPSSRKLNAAIPAITSHAGQRPRFLFLGRYVRVKGVDLLIRAMARVVSDLPSAFLQTLGGGSLRPELERLVVELGLQNHVHLGPLANPTLVVGHIKAADAIVIPSRMESIPVVFSDALQLGKPVIVTDVGDMGRLIRQTPVGFVVPPEDPSALAGAMLEFAKQPVGAWDESIAKLAQQFNLDSIAIDFVREICR